ncbi:hypothetical protein AAMO2058_001382900 [Amorphochlora amoebiformis]
MGSSLSSSVEDAKKNLQDSIETVLMKKKLLELKQMKIQRDVQLANTIARTRDMVHWMGGFFGVLITTNVAKVHLFRSGALTISHFPFLAVPTIFLYQCDLAYGTKMERVYSETRNILRNERHWFNEPMALPPYMEPAYRSLMESHNERLVTMGREADKDWAKFDPDITDEEILDHSYPITRSLALHNYGVLYNQGGVSVVKKP